MLHLTGSGPNTRRGRVFEVLLERSIEPGTYVSVNLPCRQEACDEPPLRDCPLDASPHDVRYRLEPQGDSSGALVAHYEGDYHRRRSDPGTDVDVCFGGAIAISTLSIRRVRDSD